MPPIISLLTDFGHVDTYVGQVKGAILSLAPNASLVDLSHAVPPQDVAAGAFLLWSSVAVFPPGTIHVAVVDPGVGSERRALAIRAVRGDLLIGPDNGLLVPAAEHLGGMDTIICLTNRLYWRPTPSPTFHGRDIFGPIDGHLATGVPLDTLGPPTSDVCRLHTFPTVRREGRLIHGEVLHVDTYGNLVTNVAVADLPESFAVHVGDRHIAGAPHAYYQAVAPGELLALIGSADLLEVSLRDGSAAAVTGAVRGSSIVVEAAVDGVV